MMSTLATPQACSWRTDTQTSNRSPSQGLRNEPSPLRCLRPRRRAQHSLSAPLHPPDAWTFFQVVLTIASNSAFSSPPAAPSPPSARIDSSCSEAPIAAHELRRKHEFRLTCSLFQVIGDTVEVVAAAGADEDTSEEEAAVMAVRFSGANVCNPRSLTRAAGTRCALVPIHHASTVSELKDTYIHSY